MSAVRAKRIIRVPSENAKPTVAQGEHTNAARSSPPPQAMQ